MKIRSDIFSIPCWAQVEFHPYRTANPKMTLLTIERDSEPGRELEAMLFEKAKECAENPDRIQRDNHVCFSFGTHFGATEDTTKMVVKVSDRDISIGVGLLRERW